MKSGKLLLVLTSVVIFTCVHAADIPFTFENENQEQRYYDLTGELRCLVCQNQSLADSNAELAQDLRKQIYQMITDGRSNNEIITFMVERYGDFVLYRPPLNNKTLFLWFGPLLFFICAAWIVLRIIRKPEKSPQYPGSQKSL